MGIPLEDVAAAATAIAVFVAAFQLWLGRRQAQTAFEDDLTREYREIAHRLPVKALLNDRLRDAEYENALDEFYRYVDLSNEQAFLRQNGRVSAKTWKNWQSGMRSNLSKIAFARAWNEIQRRAGDDQFQELRRVERAGFSGDPRWWWLSDLVSRKERIKRDSAEERRTPPPESTTRTRPESGDGAQGRGAPRT